MTNQPLADDNNTLNNQQDLNDLIEKSAKRGARLALAEIGLGDDNAPRDLKDLRNLLIAWRRIRAQTVEAIFRLFIHLFLVSMLALATVILWLNAR